jgi:hypothetical protein
VLFVSLGAIQNYLHLSKNQAFLTNPESQIFLIVSEPEKAKESKINSKVLLKSLIINHLTKNHALIAFMAFKKIPSEKSILHKYSEALYCNLFICKAF